MIRRRFSATTLIETIIAMVIITSVFSVSIIIYLNVASSSSIGFTSHHRAMCRAIVTEQSSQKSIANETIHHNGYGYIVNVIPFMDFEGVFCMKVSLVQDETISHQQLIYAY